MRNIETGETISCAKLRELRDLWLAACRDRAMPCRADLDLIDAPSLLPSLLVADVHYEPLRFRFRFLGTGITEMVGRDATGEWIGQDLYDETLPDILWGYERCVKQGSPIATRARILVGEKEWLCIEILYLPLGTSSTGINHILAGVVSAANNIENPAPETRVVLDWRG